MSKNSKSKFDLLDDMITSKILKNIMCENDYELISKDEKVRKSNNIEKVKDALTLIFPSGGKVSINAIQESYDEFVRSYKKLLTLVRYTSEDQAKKFLLLTDKKAFLKEFGVEFPKDCTEVISLRDCLHDASVSILIDLLIVALKQVVVKYLDYCFTLGLFSNFKLASESKVNDDYIDACIKEAVKVFLPLMLIRYLLRARHFSTFELSYDSIYENLINGEYIEIEDLKRIINGFSKVSRLNTFSCDDDYINAFSGWFDHFSKLELAFPVSSTDHTLDGTGINFKLTPQSIERLLDTVIMDTFLSYSSKNGSVIVELVPKKD